MWADHMPDFVLKVIKDTFERLSFDVETGSASFRQHHDGVLRSMSDNGSCYLSVLDSFHGMEFSYYYTLG